MLSNRRRGVLAGCGTESQTESVCLRDRAGSLFGGHVGHAADPFYEDGQKARRLSLERDDAHGERADSPHAGADRQVHELRAGSGFPRPKYFAGEQIVETGRKGVRILDKERLKQIAYS